MTTNNQVDVGLSGSSGTGSFAGTTSPTFVTPILGTPTSGNLANCTGLPVAGGGSGVSSHTAYMPICGGTTTTGAVQSVATGSPGNVLTYVSSSALPTWQAASGGTTLTFGTIQTPVSGSSVTFSSLPSGIKRITIMVQGLGTATPTSDVSYYVQLGTSGGLVTTGYISAIAGGVPANSLSGASTTVALFMFPAVSGVAAVINGALQITRLGPSGTSNTWVCNGTTCNTNTTYTSAGSIALGGELTQLSLLISAGTFNAGNINILYEQ